MVELRPVPASLPEILLLRGVMILDDPDVITPAIRTAILTGRFESEEAEAVAGIVEPGDVVLEIGAGIGFMSTLLSRAAGVERVIAVEANPQLLPYMARLHDLNGVRGVRRLNAVLGRDAAAAATATFYLREDFWMGSLLPGPNPYRATVEVPTIGLDALLRQEGVTLIVCDVEGAESFLFAEADLPGVDRVFLELHDHVTGLRGIASLFAALGSRGFAYDPRHSSGATVLFRRVRADEVLRPYPG
jgi:FkbM family methyltransferase